MTLYEFNQLGIKALPDFNSEDFELAKKDFDIFRNNNKASKYFMLLNRENNYYTLFHIQTSEILININDKMFTELCECIEQFGTVNSFDLNEETGAIEVWVKTKDTEENIVFLLFPYDLGVIKI